jgi:hypothetical protein
MIKKVIIILFLSTMIFGYTPTPAPIPPAGTPPQFDVNHVPAPMGYFVVYVGTTKTGTFDIVEPDGEAITVTADTITIGTHTSALDTTDPNGVAMKYVYSWSYKPATADIGVHYVNIVASDLQAATTARTLVLRVKQNAAPIFTGCR